MHINDLEFRGHMITATELAPPFVARTRPLSNELLAQCCGLERAPSAPMSPGISVSPSDSTPPSDVYAPSVSDNAFLPPANIQDVVVTQQAERQHIIS